MTGREFAWRIFAQELLASLEEERGEGERAASYVISPIGARMNRVLLCGELAGAEAIGADPAQPFWRARLTDATGSIAVTAGSFQPRALGMLQRFVDPDRALVIGKAHLFRGRDGTVQPSVRGEEIRRVSEGEARELALEIGRDTLDRIDLVERLRANPSLTEPALVAEGLPGAWARGARSALAKYPTVELTRFRDGVGGLLRPGGAGPRSSDAERPGAVVRREDPPAVPRPAGNRQQESIFLDLVDELAEVSEDGYADLKEATRRASGQGLGESQVEEILNRLEEDGVLEEPIVGKVRRA